MVEQLRGQLGQLGDGRAVVVERIETDASFPLEVQTSFDLVRRLAAGVRAALAAGQFPLVLAGNCFSAVGTLAGLGSEEVGMAWFDCHGDFNTPETTPSGFLDGMALATAVGLCWTKLTASVPGFRPVPFRRVLHLGGRDFDPGEREAMEAAGVAVHVAESLRQFGPAAVDLDRAAWPGPARGVYAHIDLDTLDPGEGTVNSYQKPGGLSVAAVEGLLHHICPIGGRLPLRAAALTAYDPSGDPQGLVAAAGLRLVRCLAEFIT
jgi:arginase